MSATRSRSWTCSRRSRSSCLRRNGSCSRTRLARSSRPSSARSCGKQANAVLRRRSEDVKNRRGVCNHANLLTGKLYCGCCGEPYYRRESRDRDGNVNSRWVCSGKIKAGRDSCPSFAIYESEIKPLLFEVFRDTHDASEEMLYEYERMYAAMTSDVNLEGQIAAAEGRIELALKKKSKLLELTALGQITNEDFAEMTAACNAEIKSAERELAELRSQRTTARSFAGTWRRYAPRSAPPNAARTLER